MTEDKLINEMWGKVPRPYQHKYLIDVFRRSFVEAITEAFERQRRGCIAAAEAVLNDEKNDDWMYQSTWDKMEKAMLNAPPAEKEKPVIDSWEEACETPFDPSAGEDE